MNNQVENSDKDKEVTVYGLIGLAVFFISVGLVYLIPNTFPEGTLYIVAGVLILLVTIINTLKGVSYDWFNILFAVVSIVIGVVGLFTNVKKLRNQ